MLYYKSQILDCNCNLQGSVTKECDDVGNCQCKPNFKGEKCDQCNDGYDGLFCDKCDFKFQNNPVVDAVEKCLGNFPTMWFIYIAACVLMQF